MKLEKPIFTIMLVLLSFTLKSAEVIRINQLGYMPKSVKAAVFISSENRNYSSFTVHKAISDEVVFTGKTKLKTGNEWGMKTAYRLNFSELEKEGGFYIKVGNTSSPYFRINGDI